MKSNCNSAFPNLHYIKRDHRLAFAFANGILAPFTILLNGGLLFALHKSKEVSKITGKYIFGVALSDFCIGIILQPMVTVLLILSSSLDTCAFEWIVQFLSYFLFHQTGILAIIVAIDRYFHMKYLNQYNLHMTTKRAKIIMFSGPCFALSMGIVSTTIKASSNEIFYYYNIIVVLEGCVFLLCLTIAYKLAYSSVKRRVSVFTQYNQQCTTLSADTMLLKAIMLILGLLFITFVPFQIANILWTFTVYGKHSMVDLEVTSTLELWMFLPVILNSCLNSLIYSCCNRPVRKVLRHEIFNRLAFGVGREVGETNSTFVSQ